MRNTIKKLGTKATEEKKSEKQKRKWMIIIGILVGLIASSTFLLVTKKVTISVIIVFGIPILTYAFFYFTNNLKKYRRVKKMEEVFPDFLQLMSSNLRAGITIDRSMLLSVREEFDPLDKEIQKAGREIATGKSMETSLLNMGERIGSEKIQKTILLIISGMRAGGNLATLLDQTATNLRESDFIEKKAASSVLMYVIFIFIAVSAGAPALFALSTVLVEILTTLLAGIPAMDSSVSLPFTLSTISISVNFIIYFALTFIVVIDILASLVLGLVSKGEEREGIKYLPAILIISLVIFFAIRFFLSGFMQSFFQ
ncbi:MAG: type II secretion system F family protein [Candidatus Nanoarchaeia archaeon]|nr:type II secretion system F family protein [Candidatus Nanoarchaeia archaeon]MDD5740627.1 type II secretion system F family protein [Candidatus Nanoarchaeia archaeon]